MAAVAATADEVDAVLARRPGSPSRWSLANHNAPAPGGDLRARPPRRGGGRRAAGRPGLRRAAIPVACAFHSPLVAGGRRRASPRRSPRPPVAAPALPGLGEPHRRRLPGATPDALRRRLAAQIGAPVRFVEQIEAMYAAGARIFVEAGPGRVLTGLVAAILGDRPHLAVACDRRTGDAAARVPRSPLAELAVAGVRCGPAGCSTAVTPSR